MLRLADADVIPMDFTSFANTVADYATEVKGLADQMRADAEMERSEEHTSELQSLRHRMPSSA